MQTNTKTQQGLLNTAIPKATDKNIGISQRQFIYVQTWGGIATIELTVNFTATLIAHENRSLPFNNETMQLSQLFSPDRFHS